MEYSLNNLSRLVNFQNLSLNDITNGLNLIGLEIDDIKEERDKNLCSISLLIKIPSNREDLIIESFFLKEFSQIFLLQIVNYWKKLRKKYGFLLKQKYSEYLYYESRTISSENLGLITYFVECEIPKNQNLPIWIKKKLQEKNVSKKSSFIDYCLELSISQWSENFQFSPSLFQNHELVGNYDISYTSKTENFYDQKNICHTLSKGTIFLKSQKNELITILGKINLDNEILEEKIKSFEFLFFCNPYFRNSELEKNLNSKLPLKKIQKIFLENFRFSFQRFLTLIDIFSTESIKITKYINKKNSDNLNSLQQEKILSLRKKQFQNILNLENFDEAIFQKAGLKMICSTPSEIFFHIPNSRKDIQREIDIIEEYSRFIGYQNFLPIFPKSGEISKERQKSSTMFLKQFFLNYGFVELQTSPLIDEKKTNIFSVSLNNPLNKEFFSLRTTLFIKLIEIFQTNFRQTQIVTNFFEIGRVFSKFSSGFFEEEKFATIFQFPISTHWENQTGWFAALGFIENLLTNFGYKTIQKYPISKNSSFFHPTRSILFCSNTKLLASFGEIHPIYFKSSGIQNPIYLFEINLNHFPKQSLYTLPKILMNPSKFPSIKKDLSILADQTIDFLKIKREISKNCQFLKTISFFDIYFQTEKKGKVKIGIRLEFQSNVSSLTNNWIEEEVEKIEKLLVTNFELQFER